MKHTILSICAIVLAWTICGSGPARAEQKFVTIGTGGVTGVYFAAGGAICRELNRERKTTGIRCSVESTSGSVFNINQIWAGDLDFALVQSDLQFNAYNGVGPFKSVGAFKGLRTVFSLYPEAFTVLASKESGIATFEGFKGKRMNVGVPGSGARASIEELLAALGWHLSDFSQAAEFKPDEQGKALCDGKVDGFFYIVGHPSANIQDPIASCGARLVPLTGPAVDKLIGEKPYYAKVTIPGGFYPNHREPTPTYGVLATLVTSALTPDATVYALVKAVFENFEEFKDRHPAFAGLDPQQMIRDGLSAPLHGGALKYYREKGWK